MIECRCMWMICRWKIDGYGEYVPPAIHTNSSGIYGIVHIDERASGVSKVLFLKLYLRRLPKIYLLKIYTLSVCNLVWERRKLKYI